jgi:hypothetical protein
MIAYCIGRYCNLLCNANVTFILDAEYDLCFHLPYDGYSVSAETFWNNFYIYLSSEISWNKSYLHMEQV